jgi:hypothetical protein
VFPLEFDFPLLDDLALAAEGGAVDSSFQTLSPAKAYLGPIVEFLWLHEGLPALPRAVSLRKTPFGAFLESSNQFAISHKQTASSGSLGIYRVARRHDDFDDTDWAAFRFHAQREAEATGIPKTVAHMLIGAITELEDNNCLPPTISA